MSQNPFKLKSNYQPKGDQPKAIQQIVESLKQKNKYQTLKGVTGTGKTFVMAKIIEKMQKKTLILSHNKTLAAQLYKEFKEFFPDNRVEYFISYYDYYQPEAYVAKKDLYIEKDASINDEIDKLRLRATTALMSRDDVIIVASVSCIYGLGSPEHYQTMNLLLKVGQQIKRDKILTQLVEMQYERNDMDLTRGKFKVTGSILEIVPAYSDHAFRIEFWDEEIEKISEIDYLSNVVLADYEDIMIFPAKHFVMPEDQMKIAFNKIEQELKERQKYFDKNSMLLEKERIYSKTTYDLEMMRSVGYCSGIENYSRHLSGRKEGEPPAVLLDYFEGDYLIFVDESHISLPQVRGMFNGDRARKLSLVNHGFRLPSALDNRPLYFDEFDNKADNFVYVSATPSDLEIQKSSNVVEMINRPTGLLDPKIEVRSTEGQIDNLYQEIKKNIAKDGRILVLTLTKKLAETISDFFQEKKLKIKYLHHAIESLERIEIIHQLRKGDIDVIVGINLLREGLDLPEVRLVAILDADKVGFLRSKTSLIQIVGRAARNSEGYVLMYADKMSSAMKECIEETDNRRKLQLKFNQKNNITPKTVLKKVDEILPVSKKEQKGKEEKNISKMNKRQLNDHIAKLSFEMKKAADLAEYEKAIDLRDRIEVLKKMKKI